MSDQQASIGRWVFALFQTVGGSACPNSEAGRAIFEDFRPQDSHRFKRKSVGEKFSRQHTRTGPREYKNNRNFICLRYFVDTLAGGFFLCLNRWRYESGHNTYSQGRLLWYY
jgi:hypothetical protein